MATDFAAAEDWVTLGDLDRTIEEYGRLIDAGAGGSDALLARAALYRQRGALGAALADLERADRLAPDSPWPQLRLGQLADASGRNVASVEHLLTAVARAPDNKEMRINLAHNCSYQDWLDIAYHAVRQLPEDLPDWWAGERHRAVLHHRARRTEALALLGRRRGANDMILVRWELALRLFALGRIAVARRLCEGLMADIPDSFPAFLLLSKIITRVEGVPAAIAFLESIRPRHGDNPEYPLALAQLLHEDGRFAEMLATLPDIAVADMPEHIRYIVAVALLALGRAEALRRHCRAWMAAAPLSVPPAGLACAVLNAPPPVVVRPSAPAAPRAIDIVQFWDSSRVPDDVAATMASWRRFHPAAAHSLFDEARAIAYLADHFGAEAAQLFGQCHHVAMKADYFRVAFLLRSGGNYIDADELCLRPMDAILGAAGTADIVASLSGDVPGYLHNWYLGARAGSPVMRLAVDDASAAIARAAREGRKPDIWQVTGPGLITRAVGRYLTDEATPPPPGAAILMPLQQYRNFARTRSDLAYKRDGAANWNLA